MTQTSPISTSLRSECQRVFTEKVAGASDGIVEKAFDDFGGNEILTSCKKHR